ncbi:Ig-like domain-containing protein [Paenibacillus jiagnxiensis]|uniref:Ig-like domain-containing protein n=1 Tax=Paenibacillus jiagnxiensis TaxID=3228926 RepID=UPI0033A3F35C
MKRKIKIGSKSLKILLAFCIISYIPFFPLNHQSANAAEGNWLTYKFDGFSDATINQFTVNGAAEVPGGADFIRLTPAVTSQMGTAFHNKALCPRYNYSFSTAFSFNISNVGAGGASDGLTFTVQGGTTSDPGSIGGSLGFHNISPSFTVKYDTFLNPGSDPSANYIGIAENGAYLNQPGWYTDLDQYNTANGTNYALSNGTQYYTWIDYDGVSQNVQVRLGTSPDRASSDKILDVNNIDLGAKFDGKPFHAGFTAATGSPNYETHDINSWYFVNEYAPIETLDPQNDYIVNRPPTMSDDTQTTTVNTPLPGQAGGTDPDSDSLTYQAGTQPSNGTISVNTDGTWIYTPAPGFIGEDSFTVIVNDGKCETTEATTTVKVEPPANQPPIVQEGNVTTEKNTPVSDAVYAADPDGDPLTFTKGSDPEHGDVTVNPDGTWTYTPDPDFVGEDSFTVIVDDGKGGQTEVTINVGVGEPSAPPANHPPLAAGDNVTTEKDTSVSDSVYGTDPDGDPLTFTKGNDPEHGEVTVNPDGTWTYTPDSGFVGEDSFTVIVDDGKGGKTEVTITVGVTEPTAPPANQPPTASVDKTTTDKGKSVSGAVYGTDPDGDPLTYTKGKDPEHGEVTVNPDGTWTYTPDPGFVGEDSFTVIVDDGKGGKTEVTITVGVTDNGGSGGSGGGGGGGSSNDDNDDSRSPQLESEKTAVDVNGGSIEVGDTIEYTIRARNTVSSSQVTNMTISDDLPEQLEYVPGTMKVDGVSVTDSNDSDKGKYVEGTVTGSFGTVTDTDWHTVVFQAKITKGEKGGKIENVGEVSGGNVGTPDKPSEEITINDPAPVLESEKAAKDLNGGTIQVGDVIEYTIRTRNTVEDSVVEKLEISDALRAELQYVPGTLKVDGVTVTDAQDSDKGHYVNSEVVGQFGDVTDTDWHTIVFQAKLVAGQVGQTIENVGEVSAGNLKDADSPSEDIIIGSGSGSYPGVSGEPNNGSSSGNAGNANTPGWGGSDSGSTDSSQSGGAGGIGGTGQSGTSGDSVNGGVSRDGKGTGNKLPETATDMYGYLLAGGIILLAGLILLRRKKA